MGGSRWSEDHYKSATRASVASHGTAFTYSADVGAGKVKAATHPDMDPATMKGGMRESRDSDAHPSSNAILIGLDVTGSMSRCVRKIHESLPKLMGLLTRKDYIADPQICFCAIGDANSDQAPLQVGQFESGAEMASDLSKFYLEGNGGGQRAETYELFAYFGARHTSIDCVEKRGKLGYCFIIADESTYPTVESKHVKRLFGGEAPASVSTAQIFAELAESYHVFVIIPLDGGYGDTFKDHWSKLVGPEHVLLLSDSEACAELIAAQIGACEKVDAGSIRDDLLASGTSNAMVLAVEGAMSSDAARSNRSAVARTNAFGSGGGSNIERL